MKTRLILSLFSFVAILVQGVSAAPVHSVKIVNDSDSKIKPAVLKSFEHSYTISNYDLEAGTPFSVEFIKIGLSNAQVVNLPGSLHHKKDKLYITHKNLRFH